MESSQGMRRLLAFVATAMAAALIVPPVLVHPAPKAARPTTVIRPVAAHATTPIPGRLLVKFKAGTSKALRSSVERSVGAKLLRTIDPVGVRVLQVSDAKLGAILGKLRRDGRVEFVERDHQAAATQIPNDHYWLSEWSPVTTRATAAWDVTTGSPGVIVAVLDTGVDLSQPD